MISLDKDEHIIYQVRKHWLIFFSEILIVILMAIVPLFIIAFIPQLSDYVVFKSNNSEFGNYTFFLIIYSFYLLVLWCVAFVIWTDYYLDVWIITNKKIIDVEQKGMFVREISALHLDRIQDITFDINGLIATYLNIGTVQIQTAGQEKLFVIKGIGKPAVVHAQLNNALIQYKNTHIAQIRGSIDTGLI